VQRVVYAHGHWVQKTDDDDDDEDDNFDDIFRGIRVSKGCSWKHQVKKFISNSAIRYIWFLISVLSSHKYTAGSLILSCSGTEIIIIATILLLLFFIFILNIIY